MGTCALTMCLTDGAEVRHVTTSASNGRLTTWPPLAWSLFASRALPSPRIMPLDAVPTISSSLIATDASLVTPAWEAVPIHGLLARNGAVSSRLPCSRSAPRRQGKHGRIQRCVLLGMRWGRPRIARRRPTGGSPPGNGPCNIRRRSDRRIVGTEPCSARTVSGYTTPVRLRPRPRGLAGPTSVQHGRKLTDASDKDAGRWAGPTWATVDRLPLRVDRVVVGVVVCKRQMGSKRESSAPLGRSVLTHPQALSADRRQSLRLTPPTPETADDDADQHGNLEDGIANQWFAFPWWGLWRYLPRKADVVDGDLFAFRLGFVWLDRLLVSDRLHPLGRPVARVNPLQTPEVVDGVALLMHGLRAATRLWSAADEDDAPGIPWVTRRSRPGIHRARPGSR